MIAGHNPTVIGCALNVVGLFLLASTLLFKRPRRQIEELLGVERPQSLLHVRERLVYQLQTYVGFGTLVIGFVLVMSDALDRDAASGRHSALEGFGWIAGVIAVAIVAAFVVMKAIKEGYVRSKFRRLLREVVRDSKFNLEKNPQLSVQIGELLHIPKEPDQSVADYIAKVRMVLGTPGPAQSPPSGAALLGGARTGRPTPR